MKVHTFGFVNDDSTPVGKVHFGIIHIIDIPTKDIKSVTLELGDTKFLGRDELMLEIDKYESWSQFFISNLEC